MKRMRTWSRLQHLLPQRLAWHLVASLLTDAWLLDCCPAIPACTCSASDLSHTQAGCSVVKLWCAGQAEARPDDTSGKKRPADSERGRSSKAQRTDENERRKREPIAFKPRDSAASGSGRSAENGQREAPADLRRTSSQSEKRSVFERLHSGAGKVISVSAASQQCRVHSVLQRIGPHACLLCRRRAHPGEPRRRERLPLELSSSPALSDLSQSLWLDRCSLRQVCPSWHTSCMPKVNST